MHSVKSAPRQPMRSSIEQNLRNMKKNNGKAHHQIEFSAFLYQHIIMAAPDCTDASHKFDMLYASLNIVTQSLDHLSRVCQDTSRRVRTIEEFHIVNMFLILFNVLSLIFFLSAALKLLERVA